MEASQELDDVAPSRAFADARHVRVRQRKAAYVELVRDQQLKRGGRDHAARVGCTIVSASSSYRLWHSCRIP